MAGPFIFFDLRTPDIDASRKFYADLAGWQVTDVPAGDVTLPMLTTDGRVWGGFTQLAANDDRQAQWVPYLPVTDVDAATETARNCGAIVIRDRTELPTGSVVVITDPGGATVALWQER